MILLGFTPNLADAPFPSAAPAKVSCLPPSPRVLTTSDVANVIKRMLGSLRNVRRRAMQPRAVSGDGG
eukprot:6194991-Pleurochrysis_carterae.AAC.1